MSRGFAIVLVLLLAGGASAAADDAPRFDPKPWLADLDQMRAALASNYANLEWAAFDRGANLDDYFARARARIEAAPDAGSARAAFDGLVRRLGDGHVDIAWPSTASSGAPSPAGPCDGYDTAFGGTALVALAPGYAALALPEPDLFPAGIVASGGRRIGVLRIGLFDPQSAPSLCHAALAALGIPPDKPCDDACAARIAAWTSARMSEAFMARIEALKAAKIDALLIDVTDNGGGSEWAEAAMRIVTGKRLVSEPMRILREPAWANNLGGIEADLRKAAPGATPRDRAFLLALADQAERKRQAVSSPCDGTSLMTQIRPGCDWLADGFYGSGLVASADPARLKGKPWAAEVFSPMEYPWREGVWRGPLIVLVDAETWSAGEEFAAVLQDNRAAIIMGEPTGGAGCGHASSAEPVVLAHSGATLDLPDCVRLRRDGGNEVRGVVPDVFVGWHRHDGPSRRAVDLLAALPEALARQPRRRGR